MRSSPHQGLENSFYRTKRVFLLSKSQTCIVGFFFRLVQMQRVSLGWLMLIYIVVSNGVFHTKNTGVCGKKIPHVGPLKMTIMNLWILWPREHLVWKIEEKTWLFWVFFGQKKPPKTAKWGLTSGSDISRIDMICVTVTYRCMSRIRQSGMVDVK